MSSTRTPTSRRGRRRSTHSKRLGHVSDSERLAVEVLQTLQHIHDIADVIAVRCRGLPADQAEALLERELATLALLTKRLEGKSGDPALASTVGFKIGAAIRTRVEAQLERRA